MATTATERPTVANTTVRKNEYGQYVATRILSNGTRIRGRSRDRVEALAAADRALDAYLDLYYPVQGRAPFEPRLGYTSVVIRNQATDEILLDLVAQQGAYRLSTGGIAPVLVSAEQAYRIYSSFERLDGVRIQVV